MANVKVCRECHRVVEEEECPVCHTTNLSEDWAGYAIIIDPAESEISERMEVDTKGKFALKVR